MSAIDTSKTHRLYLVLKDQIASGAVASGDRLPSEPQLAATHNVSRVTVRRALDGLARDGLIRRSAGSGTFVTKTPARQQMTGDLTDMLAQLAAMGRDTRVQLLAFDYVDAPPTVADALRISDGSAVQRAIRVRRAGSQPFSHLITYVPEAIGRTYTRRDLARIPLLTLLERSGIIAARAEQSVSATLAGPEVADALRVEIGAPLLALTRVVYDDHDRGVEYLSALYRPDMHRIRMELTRAGRGANRYWLAATAAPRRRPIKTQQSRHQAV